MDIESAFKTINNLETREPLRKFQPQWSTIVLDNNGNIIDIIKYKHRPNLKRDKEHLQKYPNTIQITTWQGRFENIDDLKKRIAEAVELGNRY